MSTALDDFSMENLNALSSPYQYLDFKDCNLQRWDEWICYANERICNCENECVTDKGDINRDIHRLAVCGTQSSEDIKHAQMNGYTIPIIGEWIIVNNSTICDDETTCDIEKHRIKLPHIPQS